MADQLKLQIQATIDRLKSDKEIKTQLKAIQDGVKLKIGVEVDDKATKQGLKSYEQMQTALGKTAINQRKELANVEFKQAQAVNKHLDQEYAKRLRNIEAEKKASNLWNTVGVNSKSKLQSDFQTFLNDNGKIKQSSARVQELQASIKSVNDQGSLRKVKGEVSAFKAEMTSAGLTGKSFAKETLGNLGKVANWMLLLGGFVTILNKIEELFTNVIELDKQMTNLYKVTNESTESYAMFLDRATKSAKELGAEITSIVSSTADFARLGFNMADAEALSRSAVLYSNVGDMNIDESTEALISIMKGFNLESSKSVDIINKLNEVGNNWSISSKGLGAGLQRAASALALAGNSIDQSIGLITAANTVIQNPEEAGNAVKILTMRLRGMKGELEDVGESTDGMVDSISKMQTQILNRTSGKVNIFQDNGNFKSTYQIMKELSAVWKDISETDQAELLELVAGKQRGNTIASIITQFADAEGALQSSLNSTNSAVIENEKYLQSIEGKTKVLSATFQEFSNNTIDSQLIKSLVDLATVFLEILNKVGLFNVAILTTVGILGGKGILKSIINFIPLTKKLALNIEILASNMGIAAGASAILAKSFAVMLPIAGIMLAVAAFNYLNVTLSEQQGILAQAQSEYDGIKSKIESLNSELETTKSRMEELFALGTLTVTEQEELDRLKLTNEQLERQLEIQEALATLKAQEVHQETVKTINKASEDDPTETRVVAGMSVGGGKTDRISAINSQIDAYNNLSTTIEDLEKKQVSLIKAKEQDSSEFKNNQKQIEENIKLRSEYAGYISTTTQTLRDEAEGLDTSTVEGKKLKAEIEALSDKMVELTNNTKASTDALDGNAAQASVYDSAIKEMRSAVDDYAESLTYLEDIESKVADGQSLNRDEMIKLKETYPELESAIYKTANGWSVKLDKLKEVQLAEKQTTLVNAENAKKRVQTALEEALAAHRIGKFAMQTYADLWSAMDGRNIHGKVTRRDGTTVIINDSEYDRITSMYSNMKLAELEAEKIKAEIEDMSSGGIGGGGSGSKSKSGSSGDPWLESFNKELATLQHNREMDRITAEQYYTTLASLNKKYFEGRSKYLSEYRKYEEEVYKGGAEIYDSRIALSKQYIEDRNFYSNWGADNEIAAQERVKVYTEEYYRNGIISYEKYASAIRDINKSIYNAKKESIEKRYKGMQEAATEQLEREKSALESELKSDNAYYDSKIQRIQDQISALDEQADAEDRLLAIEKARIELAKVQSQKTSRIYREGIGFVWSTNQKAVSDAQSNLDGLIKDWNKYQKKLDLERQVKDFEDAKKRNEENINAQIEKLEELSKVWGESLDLKDEIYSYKGDLDTLLGTESMSYEERLSLAQQFVANYNAAMGALSAGLGIGGEFYEGGGGKTVTVKPDGNAPSGTNVGDTVVVNNGKNAYKVVEAGTSGAKYNPSSGLWSKQIYKDGGIADFTGMAQLDGTPTSVETIFNARQGKKLFDLFDKSSSAEIASKMFGNLMRPISNIALNPATSGGIRLSLGEIHVHGVNDANGLADAIINQFPNTFIQKLYKR